MDEVLPLRPFCSSASVWMDEWQGICKEKGKVCDDRYVVGCRNRDGTALRLPLAGRALI